MVSRMHCTIYNILIVTALGVRSSLPLKVCIDESSIDCMSLRLQSSIDGVYSSGDIAILISTVYNCYCYIYCNV